MKSHYIILTFLIGHRPVESKAWTCPQYFLTGMGKLLMYSQGVATLSLTRNYWVQPIMGLDYYHVFTSLLFFARWSATWTWVSSISGWILACWSGGSWVLEVSFLRALEEVLLGPMAGVGRPGPHLAPLQVFPYWKHGRGLQRWDSKTKVPN